MRTVKIAFCMLAEALACILLPLAIGRAAESDVVTPVAVAVCALTLRLRFPAPAAETVMARLETGALETSTLAAMLLLVPALLAVACDGTHMREKNQTLNKQE